MTKKTLQTILIATGVALGGCGVTKAPSEIGGSTLRYEGTTSSQRYERDINRLNCIQDLNGYTAANRAVEDELMKKCMNNRSYILDKLGGRR